MSEGNNEQLNVTVRRGAWSLRHWAVIIKMFVSALIRKNKTIHISSHELNPFAQSPHGNQVITYLKC